MKIPVLTYHSTNISGNDYSNNDHVALASDLHLIESLGVKIISAHDLIRWIQGETLLPDSEKYAVLTFDDGCQLDFYDWEHPTFGFQYSFYSLMKAYPDNIHATSFVIASNNVRKILEQTCFLGHEIWGEDWWKPAEESGLFEIENHSWDHLHVTLDNVLQKDNLKGDFSKIETFDDAENQIQKSTEYINSKLNKQVSLFAYPYGDYNSYLTNDYFPKEQNSITGAFTCETKHVYQNTNLWKIPRYVCGHSWKSSNELKKILLE